MISKRFVLRRVSPCMAAAPALAHTGHAACVRVSPRASCIRSAVLDHVLAMVTVGLLASLLGGRALWAVPASFVADDAGGRRARLCRRRHSGGRIRHHCIHRRSGCLVAMGRSWTVGTAAALAGVFAVFHGYAHGVEMPVAASAITYSLGLRHRDGIPAWCRTSGWPRLSGGRQAIRFAGAASAARRYSSWPSHEVGE